MRFRLSGAERETGVEATWEVDCDSVQQARQMANAAGYFVSIVEPVSHGHWPAAPPPFPIVPPPFPVRPYGASRPSAKAGGFGQWWSTLTTRQRVWGIVLVTVLFGLVIRPSIPRSVSPIPVVSPPSPSPSSYAPSAHSPPTVGKGGTVTLRTKDGTDVPLVASSEADDDRLMELAVAHDNVGINEMILNGRAWGVSSGTKRLIINRG